MPRSVVRDLRRKTILSPPPLSDRRWRSRLGVVSRGDSMGAARRPGGEGCRRARKEALGVSAVLPDQAAGGRVAGGGDSDVEEEM